MDTRERRSEQQEIIVDARMSSSTSTATGGATVVSSSSNSPKGKKDPTKYDNAVGGRSLMLSRRDGRIMKQARDREIFFYQLVDRAVKDHSHNKHIVATELRRFLPKYYGEEVLKAPEEPSEEEDAEGVVGTTTTTDSTTARTLVEDTEKQHRNKDSSSGGGAQFPGDNSSFTGPPPGEKKTRKKDEGLLVLESPKTVNASPGSFGNGCDMLGSGAQQFPATPPRSTAEEEGDTSEGSTLQSSPLTAPTTFASRDIATTRSPSPSQQQQHPPPPSASSLLPNKENEREEGEDSSVKKKNTELLRMLMLEDICHKFTRPCVMDLKMGDRQYGINAKDKKIEGKTRKARESTTAELGVRAAGYRRINTETDVSVSVDKYVCRAYKVPEFTSCMRKFLLYDPELMDAMLQQVSELRDIFESRQNAFRFYTTSLLMVYDYVNPVRTARVVMVDFAFTYTMEEMREAKDLAAFTTSDESYCLGLRSLCKLLKDRPVSSSKPCSTQERGEGGVDSRENSRRSSPTIPPNATGAARDDTTTAAITFAPLVEEDYNDDDQSTSAQ